MAFRCENSPSFFDCCDGFDDIDVDIDVDVDEFVAVVVVVVVIVIVVSHCRFFVVVFALLCSS